MLTLGSISMVFKVTSHNTLKTQHIQMRRRNPVTVPALRCQNRPRIESPCLSLMAFVSIVTIRKLAAPGENAKHVKIHSLGGNIYALRRAGP